MNNNKKNEAQIEQYPQKSLQISLIKLKGSKKNQALGFSKINIDKMWRSALGWEGGRLAPINTATPWRWEIGVATTPIGAAATSINTDRLLSYLGLGLGLCWESNREMLTEGEENEMKRVEGGE